MAAPSIVNVGSLVVDTAGAWTYTCQASAAAGRVFIVQVVQDGTTTGQVTVTGSTNINKLDGTAGWTPIAVDQPIGSPTAARNHLFIGRATGTAAPTISGGNAAGEDIYIDAVQFDGVNTGSTLASVIENGSAGATAGGVGVTASGSVAVAATAVTTLGPDRLALNFGGINDDDTPSNASLTGGWAQQASYTTASATGTDAAVFLWSQTVGSAGTVGGGGTANLSSSSFPFHWGVIGFALIPAASGAAHTATPADTLALADTLERLRTSARTPADTLAITDSLQSRKVGESVFLRTLDIRL